MQAIITWILAHTTVLTLAVYEIWSLIPASTVSSSSVLTLIGSILKYFSGTTTPPKA